jgi:hypothetical protein
MNITVRVHPKSKRPGAEEKEGITHVRVSAAPEKGRANKELIAILSGYYKIPKKNITIIRGETGRDKLVTILRS